MMTFPGNLWALRPFAGVAVSVSLLLILASACELPNLESPQCASSRDMLKRFYSLYIGTDAETRAKEWDQKFKPFISSAFAPDRSGADPFIMSADFPKSFRIAECKDLAADRTRNQIQFFWRDDTRSVQREIYVETIRSTDDWVIQSISDQ